MARFSCLAVAMLLALLFLLFLLTCRSRGFPFSEASTEVPIEGVSHLLADGAYMAPGLIVRPSAQHPSTAYSRCSTPGDTAPGGQLTETRSIRQSLSVRECRSK